VEVALADVVAGKVVPPPPTRRGAPHRVIGWQDLQDVAADGWRPLELDWLGTPGRSWRLRAAEGFTGRANSVLAIGDPGGSIGDAVDRAEGWYAARGLPARFAVPWPLEAPRLPDGARDGDLDRELRARGYLLDTPTVMLTAALRDVAAALARSPMGGFDVSVADQPDDDWLGVYRYRGQDLPPVAPRLLMSAPAQTFVQLRDGEQTVAVARAASSRGWTGLTAVEVLPAYRRRGLARRVVATAVEWGLERGDRSGYLQVAEANTAARGLYESTGWSPHSGYHYRVQP
jgi:GNAT superfamily N-acetyltransferase